ALGRLAGDRHVGGGQDRRGAHRGGGAELAVVADQPQPNHEAPDQLVDGARHSSPPCASSAAARRRTRCASRDCSVNSSMKPGLAAWLNSPPDSPNVARARSYSAYGELLATGVAEPLYSL